MKIRKIAALGLVVVALPLLTSGSRAGLVTILDSCTKNANGSGQCFGTFRDFRNSPGTTNFIQFNQSDDGSKAFLASWNGVQMSCTPNASVLAEWPLVSTFTGYINISWNTSGVCTTLFLNNGTWAQNVY